MDIIENQYQETPESRCEPQIPKYDDKAGRKTSPFADSPYEIPYTHAYSCSTASVATPVTSPQKTGGNKTFKKLIACLLMIVLVSGSCGITTLLINQHWRNEMNLLTQVMNNKVNVLQQQLDQINKASNDSGSDVVVPSSGLTPAQVYEQNVQTIVSIATQNSVGSGFVISANGYIVSNYHVIEGATKIVVTTYAGQEHTAKLVGYDKANDVSLMKVDIIDHPCVTLGSSDDLAVGEQVAAIGNPLGELTATLTVGYISAKDRVVTTDGTTTNMLQTDAAINSGNSGGPLLNMKGEVVGITTAKYSGTSSSGATIEGIGFAIPIDDVKGIVEDLYEYGYVRSAYLGVSVKDVDASVIVNYDFPAGAYVVDVVNGYAAKKAGICAKDIIINIGGYSVGSVAELSRVLRNFEAGETTTITVFRSGAEVNMNITFDEKPKELTSSNTEENTSDSYFEDWFNNLFPPFFGND